VSELRLVTCEATYAIGLRSDETLLEALRRVHIPASSVLLLDDDMAYVSSSCKPHDGGQRYWAYAMRNIDYTILRPDYVRRVAAGAIVEIPRPLRTSHSVALVEFTRAEALEYVYSSFSRAMDEYMSIRRAADVQVALSPGGDGRVLAECLHKFAQVNPHVNFECVIMAAGFEDEAEHLTHGVELAQQYDLHYTAYGARDVARILGLRRPIGDVMDRYKARFKTDEPEVLGTYWVQELHLAVAERFAREAIVFGFNLEDCLAERLYQLLASDLLPPYPLRTHGDHFLIAPLCHIPKRMLDALDVPNSLRNYSLRTPSVSHLRSSLYFMAYDIAEKHPSIAESLAAGGTTPNAPDLIHEWLDHQ
jgi:tRNA(Ile)-lysidine synthase TilS/MesJ